MWWGEWCRKVDFSPRKGVGIKSCIYTWKGWWFCSRVWCGDTQYSYCAMYSSTGRIIFIYPCCWGVEYTSKPTHMYEFWPRSSKTSKWLISTKINYSWVPQCHGAFLPLMHFFTCFSKDSIWICYWYSIYIVYGMGLNTRGDR